jgi:hypothetical protein
MLTTGGLEPLGVERLGVLKLQRWINFLPSAWNETPVVGAVDWQLQLHQRIMFVSWTMYLSAIGTQNVNPLLTASARREAEWRWLSHGYPFRLPVSQSTFSALSFETLLKD